MNLRPLSHKAAALTIAPTTPRKVFTRIDAFIELGSFELLSAADRNLKSEIEIGHFEAGGSDRTNFTMDESKSLL